MFGCYGDVNMAGSGGAGSVVELTTDVNASIEILGELGRQLQQDQFVFAEKFNEDSSNIVHSLHELDRVRTKAHHLLEAETITASVLRHKLNTYTSRLQAEATAVVSSARDSNTTHLQNLQGQLSSMSEEAGRLVKKHEVLELHNDMLIPELRKLQVVHSDQVKILNEKILQRAEMQIVLNETLDQLKTTTSKISSLEEEMTSLEDELQIKKETFGKDKDELLKTLDVTKVQVNEQNQENRKLNKELSHFEYEAVESALALQETNRCLQETETSISKLLETEQNLKQIIIEQEKQTTSLRTISKTIEDEMQRQAEEFAVKKQHGEEILNQLIQEVEITSAEGNKLMESRKKIKKELKQSTDILDNQTSSLASARESVNAAKRSLMNESEDGARLQTEKKELEYRLNQLRETHKVSILLLKEEIADLREKLTSERKTRQATEDNYTDLQSQIQVQLSDHSEIMTSLTNKCHLAEDEDNKMTDKGVELQDEIVQCDSNIIALRQELEMLHQRLVHTRNDLEHQLMTLENNIAEFTEDIHDHDQVLVELEPQCHELEENYTILTDQYEELKRTMIELKNKKSGLEDTCLRLQRELEKMHIPQDKLRMETLKCRTYARKKLQDQKVFVENMESKVQERERKLKAILTENDKFKHALRQLDSDYQHLQSLYENSAHIEQQLVQKLQDMKASLAAQWKENETMERVYSERDKMTLDSLSTLHVNSSDDIKQLTVISAQYDVQMKQFTDFLSKMARPKTGQTSFSRTKQSSQTGYNKLDKTISRK